MEIKQKTVKYQNNDLYDEDEIEADIKKIKNEYQKVSKLIDFFMVALLLLFIIELYL